MLQGFGQQDLTCFELRPLVVDQVDRGGNLELGAFWVLGFLASDSARKGVGALPSTTHCVPWMSGGRALVERCLGV